MNNTRIYIKWNGGSVEVVALRRWQGNVDFDPLETEVKQWAEDAEYEGYSFVNAISSLTVKGDYFDCKTLEDIQDVASLESLFKEETIKLLARESKKWRVFTNGIKL
jgi:hypothetical protein